MRYVREKHFDMECLFHFVIVYLEMFYYAKNVNMIQ